MTVGDTLHRRLTWLPWVLPLALTACDLGPDWTQPPLEVPAAYRAATNTAAGTDSTWPDTSWWRGFQSPELDDLIAAAQAQNFDILAAIARIRQADAQVRIAGASLFPSLDASASADWQRTGLSSSSTRSRSNASIDTRSYGAGLSASYVVDFWGRYRTAKLSAISSAMFSRYDKETVALTVVTAVANTWFSALALADRLAVAHKNLADAEQVLAVIRGRVAVGTATALDISQQETLVAIQRATIPGLRNQMEQQVIGLGILTGRPPEAITVQPDTLTKLALPTVAPGLPSTLLTRRPDIAAAEAQLVAANFDIATARAAFFPTVQLTGSGGFQAAALNALFSPGGTIASLAAGLTAPLFDGGQLRGQLEQAKGRYDELLADYRKSVVQAFTDVDNALTAWRYTTEQEALQAAAVASAQRSATIARAQMQVGTVDLTTVLQIETSLFSSQDTLAQVRLTRYQALLDLYNALGGGWVKPAGAIVDQYPGLTPGPVAGGVALPVGGNMR